MTGIVVATRGRLFEVKTKESGLIKCEVRKKIKREADSTTPVAVGDNVTILITSESRGIIETVEPRSTAFFRPTVGLETIKQVIAANLDQLAIVASINEPNLKTGLIDRFLIAAQLGNLTPIIILNKTDLDWPDGLDQLVSDYRSIGFKVCLTSVISGDGIEDLKKLLVNHRTIFVGHSGVGKSALLNVLHPGLNRKTREVSRFTSKGKHTTTAIEMFAIESGGYLIDSPGLKVMGLWEIDKDMLSQYYPEFDKYLGQCRFSPCSHDHEPKCAIKQALEQGEICKFRYENYVAIRNSL